MKKKRGGGRKEMESLKWKGKGMKMENEQGTFFSFLLLTF